MSKKALYPYYGVCHHPVLRSPLRSPIVALVVHWAFQGMLHMDRTELLFKAGIEVIVATIVLVVLILFGAPPARAVLLSLAISHTLDLFINAQFWVVLKHFGLVKHSSPQLQRYLSALCERIHAETSIEYAAVYGSLARGEWKATSDLDVRLVRRAGIANGVRACWFVLRERTRAFVSRFPLDVYVLDGLERLGGMSEDECPVVITRAAEAHIRWGSCPVGAVRHPAVLDRESTDARHTEARPDWEHESTQ